MVHAASMTLGDPRESVEIAAGSMQLLPVDDRSRCGAVAALGRSVADAQHVWVARDATTALPRAYVAIVTSEQANENSAIVRSAPGLNGNDSDAEAAADVVRRYADQALGLATS